MELHLICTRVNILLLLVALCAPCKFIQSPMDFGPLNFLQTTNSASLDFGRIFFNSPSAVLKPKSPEEISLLLKFLSGSSFSKVTVAARGAGHSNHGQAQALNGIVIEMGSLSSSIKIHRKRDGSESGFSYADVSGGTLWIELLNESLKQGLAPRSWTDYLYLTIGGTLSNAGISGQTFKYGPQISNVLQLDVVTGTGELVTCSETQSSDLFHAVLGGLGQFGIITSARIILQDAPEKVKWVRSFYDDFERFIRDQEHLVSMAEMVDYVEGFVVLNEQSLHSSSIAFPAYLGFMPKFNQVYYCMEFAIYYPQKESNVDQVLEQISEQLSFIPSQIYSAEVSYFDFLNRVRMEEKYLRSKGLWEEVSHPWLNMFVPKSGIFQFRDLMFENISPRTFEGPILIYPILRDKWNSNTSAVLPEPDSENTMFIVGMLRSAPPNCTPKNLQNLLQQNQRIVEKSTAQNSQQPPNRIGAKQYLSHHSHEQEWKQHFGVNWGRFLARKANFDPLNILAPGQRILKRKYKLKSVEYRDSEPTILQEKTKFDERWVFSVLRTASKKSEEREVG